MKLLPAAALAIAALGGCASDPVLRFAVPDVAEADRINVSVRSVEVREVGLPLYAELETIAVQGAAGEVSTSDKVLWADDPTRGITQGLADALSSMTRAQVAAEPWPLSDGPDARVEVRFSRALADSSGQYRMSGQYFVSSPMGVRRDVARRFDIAVPYVVENPGAIAAAQGQAVLELARQIARNGL